MAGETEVEQPQQPQVTEEKKEIAEAEAKEAETKDEKKDEEKKEEEKKAAKEEKAKKVKPPPPPPVHKKDFEKDVVYVYGMGRTPLLPTFSPYCLKLETWIKLMGITYENVNHHMKFKSKRGMLPFVEYNGEEIADSDLIIATLGEKLEKNLDAELEQEHAVVQHGMVSMLENHLRWCFSHWYTRGLDMNKATKAYNINLQSMMNSKVPNGVLQFVMKHTYFRKTIKNMKAAGFAGYTDDEMDTMGKKDLKMLSELLGDKQFFFGDEPRSLDLHAFVYLALILNVNKEVECPLRDYIESECTNLVGVYGRVKDRAWGDHWDMSIGEKQDLNPHIPKPDPPKEEEKKEEPEKKAEEEKEKAEEKKEEEAKEPEKEEDNKEKEKEEEKKE